MLKRKQLYSYDVALPNTTGSLDETIGWNQSVIQVGRGIKGSPVLHPAPQIRG